MIKYVSKENLATAWNHIDKLKQNKLPDGQAGQILTKTEDGVEWKDSTGGDGPIQGEYITKEELTQAISTKADKDEIPELEPYTEEEILAILS